MELDLFCLSPVCTEPISNGGKPISLGTIGMVADQRFAVQHAAESCEVLLVQKFRSLCHVLLRGDLLVAESHGELVVLLQGHEGVDIFKALGSLWTFFILTSSFLLSASALTLTLSLTVTFVHLAPSRRMTSL